MRRPEGGYAAGGCLGWPLQADSSSNCAQVSKLRLQPDLRWERGKDESWNYFSHNFIPGVGLHKKKKISHYSPCATKLTTKSEISEPRLGRSLGFYELPSFNFIN